MSRNPQVGTQPNRTSIENPFTKSWIQALTLAADNPVARTIKPKLDLIDQLSLNRPDTDRVAAARELWDYAAAEGLCGLLEIVPVNQPKWLFDADDIFLYQLRDVPTAPETLSYARWCELLGLQPSSFLLSAEVNSGDWMGLVRSEAVRQQQSFNMATGPQATTLHLPCTAHWDTHGWSVAFDQVEWVNKKYEDVARVTRPALEDIQERLTWAITLANETLVAKKAATCTFATSKQTWMECVASLQPLHAMLLKNAKDFSPWMVRTWCCVWPIVYREQSVLDGRADLDLLRQEIKACLTAQPRLSVWMFMYAKLVCQTLLRTGLGHCADFCD